MESININSNINLYYIPMTKLKTTTIDVYIHRDLNEEESSLNALLPYVLKRGCKLCSDSEAISKYLENLYGAGRMIWADDTAFAAVRVMGTCFATGHAAGVAAALQAKDGEKLCDSVIDLMLSIMFESTSFSDEIVEQEKKNAKDRIMAMMNDKRQYAVERCIETMFEGENYAISKLGTQEGIDKITADNLKKHYENIITSSVIDIYICGDADANALAEKIKKYTGKIAFKNADIPKTEIYVPKNEVKNITDKMDVVQGKLCMGFSTGIKPTDSDYPALMVANSIFGGGAHSKLFNNVREKLSLCYYASGSLDKNKGALFVNAGIEFKNFQKAYDEILVQLENVKNGEISQLEYESSINAIINSLESYKDDQDMLQSFYLGQKIVGTDYDIDTLKEKISKITMEDAARVFKNVKLETVYFLTGKEDA